MALVGMIVAFKGVAHTSVSFRTVRVDAEKVGVLDSLTLKKATEVFLWVGKRPRKSFCVVGSLSLYIGRVLYRM